jgi:hypothetical protein
MSNFLQRTSGILIINAMPLQAALAAQGPGASNGTATVTEQIGLGLGLIVALLTAVVLARRSRD